MGWMASYYIGVTTREAPSAEQVRIRIQSAGQCTEVPILL